MRILSLCIWDRFPRIEYIRAVIVFLFIINHGHLELGSRGSCSYIGSLVIVSRLFWVVMIQRLFSIIKILEFSDLIWKISKNFSLFWIFRNFKWNSFKILICLNRQIIFFKRQLLILLSNIVFLFSTKLFIWWLINFIFYTFFIVLIKICLNFIQFLLINLIGTFFWIKLRRLIIFTLFSHILTSWKLVAFFNRINFASIHKRFTQGTCQFRFCFGHLWILFCMLYLTIARNQLRFLNERYRVRLAQMTLVFFRDLRNLWFDLRLLSKIGGPQRLNRRLILWFSFNNSGSINHFRFMLDRYILVVNHWVHVSAFTSIMDIA